MRSISINPIKQFNDWLQHHLMHTKEKLPHACCLSTNGEDGFPNARFVSLKEVVEENFVITGPLLSRKAMEIQKNNKVALTFWWNETGRQVRIQGTADQLPNSLADKYFAERNRDSQIVSTVSAQGAELIDPANLTQRYQQIEKDFENSSIPRPENWGGYYISAVRIEFMLFNDSRFHERTLFEKTGNEWTKKYLQP